MKSTSHALSLAILGLSLSLTVGCSSSGGSPGTGGTTGTGGSTSSGGTTGTGGVKSTGGTGGIAATGGTTGTGGVKSTGGATGSAGSTGGAGSTGAAGSGAAGSGATDAGTTDGPVTYTLTVKNYLNWCDVTENGTTYAAAVPPPASFPKDTVVNLKALPNYIFVWGYWVGTAADTTASHDTNMVTTVKMDSDKTVYACCPDPPPSAPACPATSTWP